MLEQSEQLVRRDGPPTVLYALLGLLLVGGLIGYFLFLQKEAQLSGIPVLTPEAEAYLRHIDLSGVKLQAEDTFLEQTIISVEGSIGNGGERPIEALRINCAFRDPYEQELGRFLMAVVSPGDPLEAGETQSFRLAFDAVPQGWNQRLPQLYIAEIQFAD